MRTRTTWQHHHRTSSLPAVSHKPDYYSISWDIKLIVPVCVTCLFKKQAVKRQLLENKQCPHSDRHPHHQETVAFHVHNHNMFFFHLMNLPKNTSLSETQAKEFRVTVALDAKWCEHICVLSSQIPSSAHWTKTGWHPVCVYFSLLANERLK